MNNKNSSLKILYIFLLGAAYLILNYIVPISTGMQIYSIGVFMFICLGLYLSDNMKFDIPHYKMDKFFVTVFINLFFFMIWFILTWDFWVIPMFFMFTAVQIIISIYLISITFKKIKTTVYGSGEMKRRVLSSLIRKKEYEFVNIDDLHKIETFVKENKISYVILAKLHLTEEEINTILKIRMNGVEVKSYFDYMQEETYKIDVELINNEWLLYGYGFKILHSPIHNRIKRIFDISMAVVIGILTSPIMLIAALIVKLESPGPVIYSQARVGEHNVEFNVHKFRSMRNDAEKDGAKWAVKNDPRVTKFGNFMRKTRIDELPQLLNVLKGEMSFIGPRPERMVFIKDLEKVIPYYNLRHLVKPGLTGWAQVMYPYGASVEDAERKLEYDLYYIKHHSISLDIAIMFMTLKTVVFGKGR
ncbi:exopolysaccharide biosynthesis polyprenyl glycosylphosphotransferase [Fusobacterium perfoetens]|uniref:exopolysaccharide biosynthesis polyprenyl glycosylphosphotransferase n=1 Tax=Fusobacterium perfoetens TaxID=852 RepID=UPI001F44CD85|nr:exopolysaccharide biosynthesis polyprenyl glycosylphosphotransferase [Fusobacterium perfoetens]MCF2624583.1 exopolysaccharide biosynthesis polyprenyl glycosylphosphotransferase [Fusobacterium perfoetens]